MPNEAATFAGERRQVTVLFCDLCGFTALSERHDPEELRALLGRLFGEAAQVIAELGGHIDHFLGDAVMALFGAPRAHEDDAVRAVRAARELHRRAGAIRIDTLGVSEPLRMHTGIATGLVVVSHDSSSDIGELVLGDTVNVASRLTQLAGPDEIVVSEATHALTCGQFEYAALGELEVRGRGALVGAYRLGSPRRDPETLHRLTGLRAALIGREQEMSRLAATAKALRRGTSTWVSVSGAPGTGKSRLVAEFRASDIVADFAWREAHCYEYASDIPYGAALDLLRRAWDIDPADDVSSVHQKIHAGIQRTTGLDGIVAARIERLWGIESPLLEGVDPESWRMRTFDDLTRVLDSLVSRGPTVLLIEDLQWADEASTSLLSYALGHLKAPLVVISTSRTPMAAVAEWGQPGWRRVDIALDDLAPDEAAALTKSLLGVDDLPSELDRFVRLELGGNPFHIEEWVNAIVDTGVLVPDGAGWRLASPLADASTPVSIAASVAARIDLLKPELRELLQAAAVIGRVFSADMLADIVPGEPRRVREP